MILLADLLRDATTRLQAAGVASPEVDAELLAAFVLGLGRGEMLAKSMAGAELDPETLSRFSVLLERREQREPLQHLTGKAPFMTFEVAVGPGVFVPRPETEALASWAVGELSSRAPGEQGIQVLDLCSGSGVLAVTIARALPYASVTAVEISGDAVPYLTANVEELAPEVVVRPESVLQAAQWVQSQSVDMMVANPPYVPLSEIPNDEEVARWDPALALYGGEDGLDVVREIIDLAVHGLKSGGILALEHSNLHGEAVRELCTHAGFRSVATERDLTGRDRFTFAYQP